ncbi:hypothetical protein BU14_0384s0012 [Porphyra umbilicalis]|uniref:Uncharacterized protein n=1 Tax=Porphyra umbilicalis TaxID=2786 RepID=A0A1X6NWZ2_PORUM|nr:hypothetical protein BU14_0384s0012 [Porphyra umbilicalis]|eukprot:OSX73026.1 hypothetical protein BU14_0384s0012 [Porphyra umbilicalis]
MPDEPSAPVPAAADGAAGVALVASLPPAVLAAATRTPAGEPPPAAADLDVSPLATLWKGYGRVYAVQPPRPTAVCDGGVGGGGGGDGGGGGGATPPPAPALLSNT